MSNLNKKKQWGDLDNTLRIDATGNVVVKEGIDALSQSIINILGTMKLSRPHSNFGTGLYSLLFEPVSQETADDIREIIESGVQRLDNRIGGINARVTAFNDGNYYEVHIRFRENGSLDYGRIQTFIQAQG